MTAAAFFDFDGTLIDGYSAFAFLGDRAARGDLPLEERWGLLRGALVAGRGNGSFDAFMREGAHALRGTGTDELDRLSRRLYAERLGDAIFPAAREAIEQHRADGHTIVVASSALPFQIEATAHALGIDHIVCTRIEILDGICTGRVDGPVVWDEGKAAAVRAFAAAHDIDLSVSYAYGNGDEDIAFLETVGYPRPVNPKPELARVAAERGWEVQTYALPGRPGRLTRLARLGAGAGRELARALEL